MHAAKLARHASMPHEGAAPGRGGCLHRVAGVREGRGGMAAAGGRGTGRLGGRGPLHAGRVGSGRRVGVFTSCAGVGRCLSVFQP